MSIPIAVYTESILLMMSSKPLSLSNGATARGGPRPPSRVSSILPGLGRLFSNFYTLALLHLPPLHLQFVPSPKTSIPYLALSSPFRQSGFHYIGFRNEIFPRLVSQSNAQLPTWRTRVPLLVWPLSFDLSAKGDPTSSYVTGGIALRVTGVLKLPFHDKVEVPTGEINQCYLTVITWL